MKTVLPMLLTACALPGSAATPVRPQATQEKAKAGQTQSKIQNPKSKIESPSTLNPGIIHSQRLNSGVPLGGIGAGTFQLLTDGTVSRATVANNWLHPGSDAPGCFGAVWTQVNGRKTARALTLNKAYFLPTIATLDYDGLFPQARLTFPDPALPVSVSLLAFSPLVPFDLKNSSFPGAAMVMRVKNPSAAIMEVSVALSWESLLPAGESRKGTAAIIPSEEGFFGAKFTGNDPEAEMTLLAYPARAQATVTAALWDAQTTQPAWWTQFAQDGSVPNSAPGMTLSASRPAAVIAVRLTLKPGEATEIPFAVSWYVKHLKTPQGEDVGHYYEVPFAGAQDAARQLLEDWRSLYGLTEEWQKRLTFSNLPVWEARRIINAAAPLTANTIHTRDGRFAFLGTVGNTNAPLTAGNTSPALMPVSGNAALRAENPKPVLNDKASPLASTSLPSESDRQTERDETRAHQTADGLLLALFPSLAAQELDQLAGTQDKRGFVAAPASADWANRLGPPKPSRAPLIPTADTLLSTLAPNPTSVQKTGSASQSKPADNARPKSSPGLPKTPLTPPRQPPAVSLPQTPVPTPAPPALSPLDSTSAYVLQWTQFALWTGDTDFLKEHYPTLRRALLALKDEGGRMKDELEGTGNREQGTEAPQSCNRAIGNRQSSSSFILHPSSLSLWLAAMRAGQVLAAMEGDNGLAQECADAFKTGSARLEARYWNGEFYADNAAPETASERQHAVLPGDICATDQLWGQWLAYQLDLGPLLPAAHLARAAQSLQQRNDSPPATTLLPPRQIRADGTFPPGPTATACLLPASLLSDAILNIWQDQPEAGVSLLHRLDDARNTSTINYQLSTLATASDWNGLYALQGFALDLNAGRMTLAPNIPGTWRSFIAPVFAPTFWGRMEYRPSAHGGVTTFRLDRLIGFVASPTPQALRNRAELTLNSLRVQGPPRRANNALPSEFTAHVSVGTKPIGARSILDKEGFVTLAFDSPLTLTAGDRLEVDIH